MNTPIAFALALGTLLASAAGATVATFISRPGAPEAAPAALAPDRLDDLARAVAALGERQSELARELNELGRRATTGGSEGEGRIDIAQLEALVERALERRVSDAALESSQPESRSEREPAPETLFDELFAGDEDSAEARWKAIREAGLEDEALAWFEARADDFPNDPGKRYELGRAYLMKLQGLGSGPETGRLATLADEAFDTALELDPRHWEARFTKAIALSFWPPIFGKQAEAVGQFEILLQQQAGETPEPHFAQTHLLLGNLYQQLGQAEKAQAAWQSGALMFPGDSALAAKVGAGGQ